MKVWAKRIHWKGARGKVEVIAHYEHVKNNEEMVIKVNRSQKELGTQLIVEIDEDNKHAHNSRNIFCSNATFSHN